jgi:hypothetical protein
MDINDEEERFKEIVGKHVINVNHYLLFVSKLLITRGKMHDKSKYSHAEKDYFVKYSPLLKNTAYLSDKYKMYLKKLQPALKNHYKFNKHHPEHKRYAEERWAAIRGFDRPYFINNFGEIKTLKDINKAGDDDNFIYLKPYLTPIGYLKIKLKKKNKYESLFIHELVADCFIDKSGDENYVIHLNRDRQDNYCGNLEWQLIDKDPIDVYIEELRELGEVVIVHCNEKNITTIGIEEMFKKLNSHVAHDEICECALDVVHKIKGYSFSAYKIEEPRELSDVRFMNLIDIMEMLFDWMAASKQHENGNIFDSLKLNQGRFKYTGELADVFKNTVDFINKYNDYEFLEKSIANESDEVRNIVYDWYNGYEINTQEYMENYGEETFKAAYIIINELISAGRG